MGDDGKRIDHPVCPPIFFDKCALVWSTKYSQ